MSKKRLIPACIIAIGLIIYGLLEFGIIKLPAAKAKDCGSEPKPENAVVIKMENNLFDPKELTANVCDTLLFLNLDDEQKWPVLDQRRSWRAYPGFDAGHAMSKFDYFTFQVTRPGTYSFKDKQHQAATGKIIIKEVK